MCRFQDLNQPHGGGEKQKAKPTHSQFNRLRQICNLILELKHPDPATSPNAKF